MVAVACGMSPENAYLHPGTLAPVNMPETNGFSSNDNALLVKPAPCA